MSVEMVLNELSLRTAAPDVVTARAYMSGLVDTLRAATCHGVSRVLRTHSDFSATLLAPGYPLARWRNDPGTDLEARRFFRSLTAKAPFLAEVPVADLPGDPVMFECQYHGEPAQGLGAAFLLDALAVSVLSEATWDAHQLDLDVSHLDDNLALVCVTEEVKHASRNLHILEHITWISDTIRHGVRDGEEMWSRREELLPAILLCASVRRQLEALRSGHPLWKAVRDRLFEFQRHCESWQEGPFDPQQFPSKVSPESQATLNMYSRERKFRCPDGDERVFSLHVRIRPGGWRIHFIPLEGLRRIIVGYIGPHLPTRTDPT